MPARRETVHRMTRRCLGWDYRRRAVYMVTLVQADRQCPLLGRLVVDCGAKLEEVQAHVERTALGEAILAHWTRIGEYTPEIRPLLCQVMPDHLHLLLEVRRTMARPLGNAIGGFKTGCGRIYRKLAPPVQNKKLALPAQDRLFADGFQDTILFHEGQLDAMFNYLRDNPRRLAVKRLFPDLFRRMERLKVAFKPGACAPGTEQGACATGVEHGACSVPGAQAPGFGLFSALGNRFLLDRPLLQVQVSRRDFAYRREAKPGGGRKIARDAAGDSLVERTTPAFEAKRDAFLAAARHGMVLLSPCVSDGERQIAREAMTAGLPLVTLQNKGFSPVQKPPGRYFDACSAGRLLMLAPAAWPYTPADKPITRLDALVMNRICQWLAGQGAAEIEYQNKGLAPVDIDALACAACSVPSAQAGGSQ